MNKHLVSAAALATLALLAGCGGGGDAGSSGAAQSSPQGIWTGRATVSGSALDVTLVVLDDGTFYGLYGTGDTSSGLIQGSGTVAADKFTSSNGRDYAFGAGSAAGFSLSAAFVAKSSINGTATYPAPVNASAAYALNYDATYDTATSLANLAGSYTGTLGSLDGVSAVTLTIASTGAYTATTALGCKVSGSLTPRGTTSLFNMSIVLDAATCGGAVNTNGIAGLTGTTGKSLAFAAVLADRSDAVFGVASKP
jgi:hypothetical protein